MLYDAGCTANFNATQVRIYHNNTLLLEGNRNPNTGLWMIPVEIKKQTSPYANFVRQSSIIATKVAKSHASLFTHQANLVNQPNKSAELVAFAHAALFSPSLTTLAKAINKNFLHDFPGLTAKALRDHPPVTAATAMGHLDQVRKNQRPTAKIITPLVYLTETSTDDEDDVEDDDIENYPEPQVYAPTHHCYAAIVTPTAKTGQIYTDQTGKFLLPGSSGATQLFVLYDYDSNSIHAEPMRNKTSAEIVLSYGKVYNRLLNVGLKPQLHRLDNECSTELKEFMAEKDVQIQLVPPGVHRANAAERAIRTLKNHFLAGLATTDPEFQFHLWDRLLPQCIITLNLLRASRINPNLSAYAQVWGQFLYNNTPLAPPGCHVMVHEKPHQRASWAPHAVDAWYLGPALNHYRGYRVYIWETRHERTSDTVTWLPKIVKVPQLNPTEVIIQSTSDITEALKLLHQQNAPSNSLVQNENHIQALCKFQEIFVNIPSIPEIIPVETIIPSLVIHDTAPVPAPLQRVEVPTITVPTPSIAPIIAHPQQRVVVPPPLPSIPEAPELRRSKRRRKPSHKVALQSASSANTSSPSKPRSPSSPTPRKRRRKSKRKYKWRTSHTASSAINVDTGKLSEYRQLIKSSEGPLWEWSSCEEWARLAQGLPTHGIPREAGTDTIRFIRFQDVPKGRKVTYPRCVCTDRPNKSQPRQVRMTVGGDQIECPENVSTHVSEMAVVKTHINSTISTDNARSMTIDIQDFYLNTIMKRAEYMRVPMYLFPQQIIDHYGLNELEHEGYVYVEINKGMYGLPQAGKLANNGLIIQLDKDDYYQCKRTPGLFKHKTRPISFTLVVDDFGVKYVGKEHVEHLMTALREKYVTTLDWTGSKYLGLTIDWDYENRTVDISMPGYIEKALQRFQHIKPIKPQHSPHVWNKPTYGATQQMTAEADQGIPLEKTEITRLQQIVGVLLYYARAVDSTMLVALGTIAAAQKKATTNTMLAATQLLDYAATHDNAKVRYKHSDMILKIHSDASYLSESQSRSRAGGLFFLGNKNNNTFMNGAVYIHSSILKVVVQVPLKPNAAHYSTTHKKLVPYDRHLKIWVIHNQQHHYKLIMLAHSAS